MSNASPRSLLMRIEETLLALILALMCGLTFYNVVLRGWFNGQFLWGLEATLYLFAWLVLLGLGYLTRTKAHLGVDALINLMSNPVRMVVGVIIGICCIIYALLLLKGAYDFVANYYNLPRTIGRVIPEGFEEMRLQNYQGFKGVLIFLCLIGCDRFGSLYSYCLRIRLIGDWRLIFLTSPYGLVCFGCFYASLKPHMILRGGFLTA